MKAYVAMKAQKAHDEVMKQPHVAGRHRAGVGSDTLREIQQLESRATHHKKVLAIRKTKHLASMDGKTGNWLLFATAQGITWIRDGTSEPDVASAGGDVIGISRRRIQAATFCGHRDFGRGTLVPR